MKTTIKCKITRHNDAPNVLLWRRNKDDLANSKASAQLSPQWKSNLLSLKDFHSLVAVCEKSYRQSCTRVMQCINIIKRKMNTLSCQQESVAMAFQCNTSYRHSICKCYCGMLHENCRWNFNSIDHRNSVCIDTIASTFLMSTSSEFERWTMSCT